MYSVMQLFAPSLHNVYQPMIMYTYADFTHSTIIVEIPAYVDGVFELPNDLFSVIDDNINEIEQIFAVVAEVGADVPDGISFFQTKILGEIICHGRSGATQIIIEDNDCKLLTEYI